MDYSFTSFLKNSICINCGKYGHDVRCCSEPVTSCGIININIIDNINETLILQNKFNINYDKHYRIFSKKFPNITCFLTENIEILDQNEIYKLDNDKIPFSSNDDFHKFCYYKDRILFLMVSRKFSLGFIEFARGRYNVSDVRGIIRLFEQMYDHEIKYIRHHSYDDILYYFLNRNNESRDVVLNKIYEGKYANEYCEAKIKFNTLLNPSDDENNDVPLDLNFYTKYIKPKWKKNEWGFPKGRREKRIEDNITCACREFEEETGYTKDDYIMLNKIEPIEEKMIGTNGINYKHIYYLALNNCDKNLVLSDYDKFEIGEIRWFTYTEAMENIRPYHIEKKKILTKIYLFILNYLIQNIQEI